LPGTRCCGSSIHSSNVLSFQTTFADLIAGEYRLKLGRFPASPQIGKARSCHVLIWLQGMTSRARTKYSLASSGVPISSKTLRIKRK
jgi:hypothetical protein